MSAKIHVKVRQKARPFHRCKLFTTTEAEFIFLHLSSFTPEAPTGNKQNVPNFAQISFGPVPRSERKIIPKGLF